MESTEWGFAYISISSEVMKQLWMCVNESKQQTEISEWICWHRASRAAASWRGSCCMSAASQVSPAVCRLQQPLLLRSVSAPDRPRVSDRLRVSLQTDPVKRFPFQAGLSPHAVPVSTTMLMMQRLGLKLRATAHRLTQTWPPSGTLKKWSSWTAQFHLLLAALSSGSVCTVRSAGGGQMGSQGVELTTGTGTLLNMNQIFTLGFSSVCPL